LILEDITGLTFPKIAAEIESYHSRIADGFDSEEGDTEPADGASQDQQPDLSQESLGESAVVDTLEPAGSPP